MDFASAYCATRRDLEQRSWALTDRLCLLTAQLLKMIGQNHRAFLTIRQECRTTRVAIADSNQNLRDHRREHSC